MGKHSKPSRREQYKNDKTIVKHAPSHLKENTVKEPHKKRNNQRRNRNTKRTDVRLCAKY